MEDDYDKVAIHLHDIFRGMGYKGKLKWIESIDHCGFHIQYVGDKCEFFRFDIKDNEPINIQKIDIETLDDIIKETCKSLVVAVPHKIKDDDLLVTNAVCFLERKEKLKNVNN